MALDAECCNADCQLFMMHGIYVASVASNPHVLSVIMLYAIMLSFVMLNVVAPPLVSFVIVVNV
jgi:hypothetical protein